MRFWGWLQMPYQVTANASLVNVCASAACLVPGHKGSLDCLPRDNFQFRAVMSHPVLALRALLTACNV